MRLRLLVAVALLGASPAAAQDAATGQRAFLQCRACHGLAAGERKIGPTLHKLMGRRAGTQPGYAYSPALRKSGLVWDRATLDRFLARPAAVAPGNKMAFAGVADAKRRAALIDYLEQATR
jgi:cytochrome c